MLLSEKILRIPSTTGNSEPFHAITAKSRRNRREAAATRASIERRVSVPDDFQRGVSENLPLSSKNPFLFDEPLHFREEPSRHRQSSALKVEESLPFRYSAPEDGRNTSSSIFGFENERLIPQVSIFCSEERITSTI